MLCGISNGTIANAFESPWRLLLLFETLLTAIQHQFTNITRRAVPLHWSGIFSQQQYYSHTNVKYVFSVPSYKNIIDFIKNNTLYDKL